jgi:DNA-binding PadR family transcriptional regulator
VSEANSAKRRGSQLTRGRKFMADELHLMVLGLLNEHAYHGYELIKEFGARSHGFYSPSPGALYPLLKHIEELGQTTVELQGKRKCYRLSEPGRHYLRANRARADQLFDILRHAARKMLWMARAMPDGEASEQTGWLPDFVEARIALKEALLASDNADHHEQRRIAAILQNALAQIQQHEPALHHAPPFAGDAKRHDKA